MNNVQQKLPESAIDEALTMAAVDACEMLRKWSDSAKRSGVDDSRITPFKICEFQNELKQRFAEIYFGTHSRLKDIDI